MNLLMMNAMMLLSGTAMPTDADSFMLFAKAIVKGLIEIIIMVITDLVFAVPVLAVMCFVSIGWWLIYKSKKVVPGVKG